MIDRSKWSFSCIAIIVLCITHGAEAQDAPSPAKAEPKKDRGEEKAVVETQKPVPSQNEQPKQDAQSETKAETTAQPKSVEQTATPQVVSEPQPENVPEKGPPMRVVSQNPRGAHVDTARPADDDGETAEARIGLGLEINTVWNTDPGFDLFSEDDVSTQVGVWFSYDLLQITKKLTLAGEIGCSIGGVERKPQDDLNFTWEMNSVKPYLAANLRYSVFSWMHPHIRLAGGALFETIEYRLRDQGPYKTKSENEVSGLGTLGAGVTFRTPTSMFESDDGAFASLSLGLLIEAGYTVASSMSMTLDNKHGEDPIETRTAELGELDLSGPYIRTSVLVRF